MCHRQNHNDVKSIEQNKHEGLGAKYLNSSHLYIASPINFVLTMTVDAGTAEALVHLGETCGVMVTFGTHAGEAVGAVDTGAAVVARVDGTFVDVDVTHRAYNRWKENKLVFH